MDLKELRLFLETLTIKQLKDICNTPRSWGVYNSYPAIRGYSRCKNKGELILFVYDYFAKKEKPRFMYPEPANFRDDSLWGDYISTYDFVYNGTFIEYNLIKQEKITE